MKQKTEFYQHDWNNMQQLSHRGKDGKHIEKMIT